MELSKTAFVYYKDAPDDVKLLVEEFFLEMDRDANDRVSLSEFLSYMEMHEDCAGMKNRSLFDELKREGSEELDFMGVVTLFYIVYSGRPFCNGRCGNFIKGDYFTCVHCFDHSALTFNVCVACFHDANYVHGHNKFLDNFVMLERKRMEAFNQRAASPSSILSKSKSSCSTTTTTTPASAATVEVADQPSSTSTNQVVALNPRPKNSAARKALKTVEVLLALGNIFASTQCTIM